MESLAFSIHCWNMIESALIDNSAQWWFSIATWWEREQKRASYRREWRRRTMQSEERAISWSAAREKMSKYHLSWPIERLLNYLIQLPDWFRGNAGNERWRGLMIETVLERRCIQSWDFFEDTSSNTSRISWDERKDAFISLWPSVDFLFLFFSLHWENSRQRSCRLEYSYFHFWHDPFPSIEVNERFPGERRITAIYQSDIRDVWRRGVIINKASRLNTNENDASSSSMTRSLIDERYLGERALERKRDTELCWCLFDCCRW